MASLSLPRVLQLKKNSLDAEREQFEKFQTLAIQKAINTIETPVKEKHVRSTIIGTFQEQSAITYWMVATRLPLQDNRIVAWKFCNVTHKLLREGHPACLDDSQRHIGMIENLGKLWVHLREGYGRLVHLYCALLVCKLRFHARNPRFPGNMSLTSEELDAIAENDVNNYFQICVELFDYLDDILSLQAAVFDSLGNARANSMTASGQCRLAALIPCAQDSSHIYDCNVRLLFRLHAALPAATLSGHRDRFRQQFKKLSDFYKHASSLQYYRNLLTLPILPSNPPNFLFQSELCTYVTPVVSVPAPDDLDATLVDTSDRSTQVTSPDQFDGVESRASPSPQPDPLLERDRLIEHLQNELRRMRSEVSQLVQERNTMVESMREHCTRLETQLQSTTVELNEEKQRAEQLSSETPEIKQKLTETEEKAKVTDEKFQKLKSAYTQLREEHIALIRQKAEVDKMSASLRATAAQHESAKMALQQQLNDKMKDVELLQQSASSSEEIEAYKSEIENLRSDIEQARQKEVELETLRASIETLEIEHKTATTESDEKLNILTNELKEVKDTLDNIRIEKEEREKELRRVKEELVGLREKSGEEYNKAVKEKETALQELDHFTKKYEQEKQDHCEKIKILETEIDSLKSELNNTISQKDYDEQTLKNDIKRLTSEFEEQFKVKEDSSYEEVSSLNTLLKEADNKTSELLLQLDKMKNSNASEFNSLHNTISDLNKEKQNLENRLNYVENEKLTAECELQDLLQHNTTLEENVESLKKQLEDARKEAEKQRESLVHCASDVAVEVTDLSLSCLERANSQDSSQVAAEMAAKAFEQLARNEPAKSPEATARAALLAAHASAQLSAYVTEISTISTDAAISDKLTSSCRSMLSSNRSCLAELRAGKGAGAGADCGAAARALLKAVVDADQRTKHTGHVDDELADMDRAVELAALQIQELLKASQAGDTGVKLEVNGKILDACTTLMSAVKVLVQDARSLQSELGDPQTRQQMYRRNPQWSEGLISAAKAVVFAAKLLVSSADEAVSGSGRAEGVGAAAQEVAGSTAQLVAASRARAPPSAPALAHLTAASRAVASATGAVVAAVRAVAALHHEQEALDTSSLTLTATRRLEMECKVRALELEAALDAERGRLAALRRRHYQLAQLQENGSVTNGNE